MEYGLIGEKLGHSFSKVIHNMIGDYEYELKEIDKSDIDVFMKAKDFKGINVTIPYKQTVIPYLDFISDNAKKIGAVNVVINKDGKLYGYNTDYDGLKALIIRNGIKITGKEVAILGTGGTSKTALVVVSDMGAKTIVKVSRRQSEDNNVITYEDFINNYKDVDVIINTTPVGMFPNNDNKPAELKYFSKLEGVIDVIYNPITTKLVMEARKRNIKADNGLYMLVKQAVVASELFFDKTYDESITEGIYKKVFNMKHNIVLTGMPGSGKSTIGKVLSKKLNKKLIDTDELIKEDYNMEISEIFEQYGEKTFRDAESDVIKRVSKENGIIIATGGGAILRKENIEQLKSNGTIYFLDRALELIVPTDDRPLSSNYETLKKRYDERYDIYKETCDCRIEVLNEPDKPASDILEKEGL